MLIDLNENPLEKLIDAFYVIFYRQAHHASQDKPTNSMEEMGRYLRQVFIGYLTQLVGEIRDMQYGESIVFSNGDNSLTPILGRLEAIIQQFNDWDNTLREQEVLRSQPNNDEERNRLDDLARVYTNKANTLTNGGYIILPVKQQNLIVNRNASGLHAIICASHNNYHHQAAHDALSLKHSSILKFININNQVLNIDWFRLFASASMYSSFNDQQLYRLFRLLGGKPVVLNDTSPYFKQHHGACANIFHLWQLIKYTFEILFHDHNDPELTDASSLTRKQYYRIVYDFETRIFNEFIGLLRGRYSSENYLVQYNHRLQFVISEAIAYLGHELGASKILRDSPSNICKLLYEHLDAAQKWLSGCARSRYEQQKTARRFSIENISQPQLPAKTDQQIAAYFIHSQLTPTTQNPYYSLPPTQHRDRLDLLQIFKGNFLDKLKSNYALPSLQRLRHGIEHFILEILATWGITNWHRQQNHRIQDYDKYLADCAEILWTIATTYQTAYEQFMRRQYGKDYDPRQYAHRAIILYAIVALVDNAVRSHTKFIAAGFAQFRLSTTYYGYLNWAEVSKTLPIMQRHWIPAISMITEYFKGQQQNAILFHFDCIVPKNAKHSDYDHHTINQHIKEKIDYPYQSQVQAAVTYNFGIELLRQYPDNHPAFYQAMGWCTACSYRDDTHCEKLTHDPPARCGPLVINDAIGYHRVYFSMVYGQRNNNILPPLFYCLRDCMLLSNSSLVGTGLSCNIPLGALVRIKRDNRGISYLHEYAPSYAVATFTNPKLWRSNGYLLSGIHYHMLGQLSDEQVKLRAWQRLIYIRSQHTALCEPECDQSGAAILRGGYDRLNENNILATQTKQPNDTNRLQYCHYGFIRATPLLQLENAYLALNNKQLSFESKPHLLLILQAVFEVFEIRHQDNAEQPLSLLSLALKQSGLTRAWINYLSEYASLLKQRQQDHQLFYHVIVLLNGLYQFCPIDEHKNQFKAIICDLRRALLTWCEQTKRDDSMNGRAGLKQSTFCGLIIMTYAAYDQDFTEEDKKILITAHCVIRRESDLQRVLPIWLIDEVEYTLVQQEKNVFGGIDNVLSGIVNEVLGDHLSVQWQPCDNTLSYRSSDQQYVIDVSHGRIYKSGNLVGMPDWVYQHPYYKDIMGNNHPTPRAIVETGQLTYGISIEQGVILLNVGKKGDLNIALASGGSVTNDIGQLRAIQQCYVNRNKLVRELPAALIDDFTHSLRAMEGPNGPMASSPRHRRYVYFAHCAPALA